MDKVVVSMGGSVLIPGEDDAAYLKSLADTLTRLAKDFKLYVVVGGGRHARYYIQVARELGMGEDVLDELGVLITRMNARLLVIALGGSSSMDIPETVKAAVKMGAGTSIVVMGGTEPGHTTDTVSVELARAVGASRFVNASAVDGIYTADPRKDPKALMIEKMTFEGLAKITGGEYEGAGRNVVLDPVATGMIVEDRLWTAAVHGRDLKALESAIRGEAFRGTLVSE